MDNFWAVSRIPFVKLCFVEIPSYLGRRPFITGRPTEALLPHRIMATGVAMVRLIDCRNRLFGFKVLVWYCFLRNSRFMDL